VVRAARELPYPGVVPGNIPPPLADVYLRQDAHLQRHPGESALQAYEVLESVEEIADLDADCVVVAGPGGGKSSLLRSLASAAAQRWRDGSGCQVPAYLQGADLVPRRPLREALAAAVTADLSPNGLPEVLPSTVFGAAPAPGARWLILVDGLD